MKVRIIIDLLAAFFFIMSAIIACYDSNWHSLTGWCCAFISNCTVLVYHLREED